jgi:hypothetical protein
MSHGRRHLIDVSEQKETSRLRSAANEWIAWGIRVGGQFFSVALPCGVGYHDPGQKEMH